MKRSLSIAAIVLVIAVVAAWLWPEEKPAPVKPPPAARAAPQPTAQEAAQEMPAGEKKMIRVTFINHLGDAHIKFTVDDVEICTANAGQTCYGDVAYGKHVVQGLEGKQVVRTLDLTVDKSHPDPKVVVCFPTSPDC